MGERGEYGERTGVVTGINSHDYVSDASGATYVGCLATLKHDTGSTSLYTTSQRLQHTLEMAYATKAKITVSWQGSWPLEGRDAKMLRPDSSAPANSEGPFLAAAVWTRE
jgi:hypothetical protein